MTQLFNNRMVNISFVQSWLYDLINRFLVKNIWHLSLDVVSEASQGGSKMKKPVQRKRKKTSKLNLLYLLFFINKVHNLVVFYWNFSKLAVFFNNTAYVFNNFETYAESVLSSSKLLINKISFLSLYWSWNL